MLKVSDKNLLIVNNFMDVSHPTLAHQSEIALALTPNFNKVYILTEEISGISVPPNTEIFIYASKIDFLPFKIIKFFVLFLYLTSTKRVNVVFSHMSSRHSAIMGPILRAWGKKHVLWYAHKSKPLTLLLSYVFVDKLVSSTKGSCPIEGSKVLYIGQSINEAHFELKYASNSPIRNLVHVGRFDPSKNISLILASFVELRRIYPDIYLTIIGDPSDTKSIRHKELLSAKYADHLNQGLITFMPSVQRVNVGKVLANFDLFVHAFRGSLDKTLLEATLVGLPVATLNSEYTSEFGNWCMDDANQDDLKKELLCLMKIPLKNQNDEILRRRNLVLENHTLSRWIEELTNILNSN
jgi:glycosyltransferase involved in cell wall biosynthesis